jgi:hypothetical protein
MEHPRLPDSARVPIGLNVAEAEAAQIDEVLARPEFAGRTRAEWCREIIRSALRYYAGNVPAPDPGQAHRTGRPAAAEPAPAGQQPAPAADGSMALASDPPSATAPAAAAEAAPTEPPEPPDRPGCAHPADAWDYETGTCGACGAVL